VILTATTVLAVAGWDGSAGAADRMGGPRSQRAVRVAAPPLQVGGSAWVSVSVATLWRSPDSPRAVDAPALARPARIQEWLADLTLSQRRALNGHADTQALLGDQVRVVRLRPRWAKVVVPSQPSQLDSRGYPGWVPRRQLTARPPVSAVEQATVVARTTWLRTDRPDPARLFRISFGTRLPVVDQNDTWVRVVTPDAVVRQVRRSAVVLHLPGEPALPPSTRSLVDTATSFVGLPYLWAGLSGFGLDCSGLTWLDYRVHGITIPRDALPESRSGTQVTRPRPGDLMFYATDGLVHHVSMYVGNGTMVHAPHTGAQVQVVATTSPAYSSEYAGARRYYSP
jgi:hypothetical protein